MTPTGSKATINRHGWIGRRLVAVMENGDEGGGDSVGEEAKPENKRVVGRSLYTNSIMTVG